MGQIYKVINKQNGKIYIGQTVRTTQLRKAEHYYQAFTKLSLNNHFHSALNKHGKDCFEWKIILICEDKDLDYYEVELINKYKSSDKNIGYNLDLGGNTNRIVSEETKLKQSIKRKELIANGLKTTFMTDNPSLKPSGPAFKGKHHSEESKEKLRLLRLGKKSSEETKAKISKALIGNDYAKKNKKTPTN